MCYFLIQVVFQIARYGYRVEGRWNIFFFVHQEIIFSAITIIFVITWPITTDDKPCAVWSPTQALRLKVSCQATLRYWHYRSTHGNLHTTYATGEAKFSSVVDLCRTVVCSNPTTEAENWARHPFSPCHLVPSPEGVDIALWLPKSRASLTGEWNTRQLLMKDPPWFNLCLLRLTTHARPLHQLQC